jgi:hypothetical protein
LLPAIRINALQGRHGGAVAALALVDDGAHGTRDGLPRRVNETLATGRALVKEAKGLK